MNNELFYCYSKDLYHFIMSFRERYVSKGINKNTNTKYYSFNKSERLDKIIELYNRVKHSI